MHSGSVFPSDGRGAEGVLLLDAAGCVVGMDSVAGCLLGLGDTIGAGVSLPALPGDEGAAFGRWCANVAADSAASLPVSFSLARGADGFLAHATRLSGDLCLIRLQGHRRAEGVVESAHGAPERSEWQGLERELRLAASVFDNAAEAIMITDATASIVKVNRAFEDITGFAAAEIVGQRPSVLSSGRHDAGFYARMWQDLASEGRWYGEIWNRRCNGEEFPEWLSISAVKDADGGVTHYIGIFTDISQRKHSEAQIERLSWFDTVTDLPNRALFIDRLEQAIVAGQRRQRPVGVLLAGLDRMRAINDSLGYALGDHLLREVARRLQGAVRPDDTVGRYVGDQFVVLVPDMHDAADLGVLASRLLDALALPFHIAGHELAISSSIGISHTPRDGEDAMGLIKCADMAMHHAKKEGRNNYQFYTGELEHVSIERLMLQASLRQALSQEQLVLYYQPQIDVASGRMLGVEALVRWRHPDMGMIAPNRFIPLAEETGQIVALGDWVLRQACQQGRRWHDAGHPLTVAVNLSARQFKQKDLVERIEMALEESGLPPTCLELELTESMIMQDPERVAASLRRLRQLGVSLSIDDFGTGYSSLAYLKRFPLDKLKIDRSFVSDIPHDSNDMAIAQAVIALGHSLRLKVVAEGVETAEQVNFLSEQGCHSLQGFYYSPPVSAEAMALMLHTQQQAATIAVQ